MDYSIPNEEQILHTWYREQTYSMKHWALVVGLAIMTFLSFQSWGIMVAGYVIIFLFTALPRIFNIVIYAIIATILTALIPPLGIILTVIFFFMLILPFIAHSIHDFIDFNDYNDYSAAHTVVHANHASTDYTNTDISNPGVHHVDGHWRSTPSGGETYVDPYIRTNPDGIEENNFSHKD